MDRPESVPSIVIQFAWLDPAQSGDLPLPRYMTAHASGMDICAAVTAPVTLAPGQIRRIPTGFAVAIPPGYEAQIRARSGLAAGHGIGIVNAPGTIDADYRGEVQIALINWSDQPFTIGRGDRIAQMVVQRIFQARLELTDTLPQTDRQGGGFGHTGR